MAEPLEGTVAAKATFGQRLLAWVVDSVVLGIVGLVLVVILPDAVAQGLGFVVGLAYYVYLEGSPSGQTLGKRALGIRVVDAQTLDRIDPMKAFIRYIGKIISGIACAIGYLWMLWDAEKQTWHDKIATTYVVVGSAPRWPGY